MINDGVRYQRRLIDTVFIEIEGLALNKERQFHCWIIWIIKYEGENRYRYSVFRYTNGGIGKIRKIQTDELFLLGSISSLI